MKKSLLPAIILLLLPIANIYSQVSPVEKGLKAINTDVLKAQMGFLASDWTEGRESGQKGEYIAGDYIASMLQLYGVKPAGDYPYTRGFTNIQRNNEKTYFQNFILIKTSPGDEHAMKVVKAAGGSRVIRDLAYNVDFTMRPSAAGIELDAPVVFAGYGFRNDKLRYNDFSKLDLTGKFVLKISGIPGFAREALSPAELTASARETENILRSMGAVGIIEINPNSSTVGTIPGNVTVNLSPSENNPRSGRPFASYSLPGENRPAGLISITISSRAADDILEGTGIDLDDFIKKAETSRNLSIPVIEGRSVYFKTTVRTETVRVRNVIGVIEGEDPDQIIVLGAHYDHIGTFDGYTWNGADDNASGTVGVMTIARAIMESGKKPGKTIVIALWTAEELGLLGSRYYVENLSFLMKNLRLNVNFDMISRYIADDDPDKVIMTYSESNPGFRTITETNIKKYGIGLNVEFQPSKDPPGGSDHRSFTAYNIPIMRFKPGHREEYHTPADEVSTVDWDIMEKIVKISFANVWDLANSDW